jgi:hypothetical protein
MAYIDPHLMRVFRSKIRDPRCFRRVCGVLGSCRIQQLRSPRGAYGVVDRLSACCGVPITRAQRDNAARWLMGCGIDPRNPAHRSRMKRMVFGGW